MTQQEQQESRSSVEVTLTAKGEAQVKVKVCEGEVLREGDPRRDPKNATISGNHIPEIITERLMATINSLERQRIKVVGRELPEVGQQVHQGPIDDQMPEGAG